MNSLRNIRNFLQLDERIATSGMPRSADFQAIGEAGFAVVINLALPTSDHAINNEGELVTRAGMSYIHIPANFESPQPRDFILFRRILESCDNDRVFIHCAANMRVSAFLFLHRVLQNSSSRDAAEQDLKRIWNPSGVWRGFINEQLAAAGQLPLR